MGNAKINFYPGAHHMEGETDSEYLWRVHKEMISLDSTAPRALTQAEMKSLCDVSGDQNDFDDAADTIGGSWYTWYANLTSEQQEQCRYGCADLAALS